MKLWPEFLQFWAVLTTRYHPLKQQRENYLQIHLAKADYWASYLELSHSNKNDQNIVHDHSSTKTYLRIEKTF